MVMPDKVDLKVDRASTRLRNLDPESAAALNAEHEAEQAELLEELTDGSSPALKKPSSVSSETWQEICRRMQDNGPDFDIFKDYGDLIVKDGIAVEYIIKKGGKQVATLDSAGSWDTIHRDYGPGSYRVVLRLEGDGVIRRHQTKTLGERVSTLRGLQTPTQEASTQGITLEQVMNLLREERLAGEKRIADVIAQTQKPKDEGMGTTGLMLEMFKMMNAQQSESMKALAEAIKGPQTQSNPMTAFTQALELAKLLAPGKGKDGLDTLQLFTMLKEERAAGKEEAREMMDMLDEKLAERTEGTQPKSAIDKILEKAIEAFPVGMKAGPAPQALPQRPGLPRVSAGIPRQNPVPRAPVQTQPQGEPMTAQPTVKDRVFNALAPNLEGWIRGGVSHADAAAEAEQLFSANGLTREAVLASVTLDDVRQKMAELKVPKMAANWVESFYATYQNKGDGSGPAQ